MYLENVVATRNPLKYWQELLEQWIFLVGRLKRVTNGKYCVYSYKERTNVGLLASAAVANGWVALEECRSEKLITSDSNVTYNGRTDLLIWRDIRHHEIEAKFVRVTLTSSNTSKIKRVYEQAISDSLRSTKNDIKSYKKIGITFIVPVIRQTKKEKLNDSEISELLQDLIDYIVGEYNPHILAYTFPGMTQISGSTTKQACGIILVGAVT